MRKLYDFSELSKKLDKLKFPQVTESRFEIVRRDFSDEEQRGNITFQNDGIYLNISGVPHKGYMYIKNADVNQYGFPKFHIANCQTIVNQRNQNKFHGHYIWSNSNIVEITQRGSMQIHKDIILKLCAYCRNMADITQFNSTEGFYKLLDIQIAGPIDLTDLDIFGYVKDWQRISKLTRIRNEFVCNSCKLKIENKYHQRYIQVHHLNGIKTDNRSENLECLCPLCHSNVDQRHSENFKKSNSYMEVVNFVKIFKDELQKINNKYLKEFIEKL